MHHRKATHIPPTGDATSGDDGEASLKEAECPEGIDLRISGDAQPGCEGHPEGARSSGGALGKKNVPGITGQNLEEIRPAPEGGRNSSAGGPGPREEGPFIQHCRESTVRMIVRAGKTKPDRVAIG